MIQTTNQNPLSVAGPISLPKPGSLSQGFLQEGETSGFKSNLDDQLAQAGGIEGAQANLAAILAAQSQGQPIQKPVLQQAQILEQLKQLQMQKGMGIERPGKELGARMDMADYSPASAKVSGGVNAASTIAGLKPWDHEWVFEGNPNPAGAQDVHPLIGPSNTEAEMAELQQAMAQIRGQSGMNAAPTSAGSPGAMTQVSQNLREAQTRGDLDIADQLVAIQATPAERMQMAEIARSLGSPLHQQIQAMNGQVTDVSGNERAGVGGTTRKVALVNGQLAGGSGLSGAEFMNTLNVVRPAQTSGVQFGGQGKGPVAGAQVGQFGQAGQVGQFGQLGQAGMTKTGDFSAEDEQQSGGFGERSGTGGLRLIDSAKTGRLNGNGDEFVMTSPVALHSAMQNGQSQINAPSQFQQPVMQLSGQVVPGSMAQDQLAHDAILNMSTGIRNLSAQGGGEMRIRLKPENLGELHLRVVSQGGEVGIHIQASDDKAKKILQDSLGSLRDGLASQNLTLGKVAIEVAQTGASHDMRNDTRQQSSQGGFSHHQSQQFGLEQNANGNRGQREAQWRDPEGTAVKVSPLKSTAALMSGSNVASSRLSDGRLDVMA